MATTAEFKEFERNLEFARRLVSSGRQLEQLQVSSFDIPDLYRAAWVQAVSALDHWIHREIYTRIVQLVGRPTWRLPRKLRQLSIPLELVEAARGDSSRFQDGLAQLVRERFGWVAFQNPEKIKDGLSYVTDVSFWPEVARRMDARGTDRALRDQLADIARRRNQIVHEADLGDDGKRPVDADQAADVVDWINRLAVAILGTLEGSEGTAVTGTAYLYTLGHAPGAVWVLTHSRAGFSVSQRAQVDRLTVGDELFLVTTRKCWGERAADRRTLVIGRAVITSPVEPLDPVPELAGQHYPRGCALRLERLAPFGQGVDLRALVPRLAVLPNDGWGIPLRRGLAELPDADADLLRTELQAHGTDPAISLASYPR